MFSAYVPARMRLSIPWQGEGEIVWHRRWVNDAMDQEDDRITLKFGDEEETVACVWRLLRDKLEKPLVDVIFEKIAAAVEKRVRR